MCARKSLLFFDFYPIIMFGKHRYRVHSSTAQSSRAERTCCASACTVTYRKSDQQWQTPDGRDVQRGGRTFEWLALSTMPQFVCMENHSQTTMKGCIFLRCVRVIDSKCVVCMRQYTDRGTDVTERVCVTMMRRRYMHVYVSDFVSRTHQLSSWLKMCKDVSPRICSQTPIKTQASPLITE